MTAFDDFLEEVGDGRSQACWNLELDALQLTASGESAAFGDGGFGEYAFGEDDAGQSSGVITLTFSDLGFTSKPSDTPANTYYDARVVPPRIERRIIDRDGLGGLTSTNAEVRIINRDGELDLLPRAYALDGRAARLYLGRPGDARASFGQVFSGVIRSVRVGEDAVRVLLSDGIARLVLPLNRNTYAGTGGLEGGTDLKGKPKPKGWGQFFNVSPPLVNAASLIYQVHDGAINDVPNVWDRQIPLTKGTDYASQTELETTAPSAGNYRVWKAGGFFRLGSTPAGTVTCNGLGDASGSGYVNKTADIVNRVLVDQALLTAGEIDSASFTQLNVDAPAAVGVWRGAEVAFIADVVRDLLVGVGAFGGFSRLGKFNVGVISTPAGTPAASYTTVEIRSLEREPLPQSIEPIVWRTRVGWQRNYTVQNDLAAGVTADRRAFAAEVERLAIRDDATIRSRRSLAREFGPVGMFANQADADTEAVRLLGLWGVERGIYNVPLPAAALARDIGEVVSLTYPRYGFDAGVLVRVLSHEINGTNVNLRVLA